METDNDLYKKLFSINPLDESNFDLFLDELKIINFEDPEIYVKVIVELIFNEYFNISEDNICKVLECIGSKLLEEDLNKLTSTFITRGFFKYILILLKFGADINSTDSNGKTLLSVQVSRSNHENVKYLLDNGADQLISDNYGRLPIYRVTGSQKRDHPNEVFKLLVNNFIELAEKKGKNVIESLYWLFSQKRTQINLGPSEGSNVVDMIFTNYNNFFENNNTINQETFDIILSVDPNLSLLYIVNNETQLSKYKGEWIPEIIDDEIRVKLAFTRLIMKHEIDPNLFEYFLSKGANPYTYIEDKFLYETKTILDLITNYTTFFDNCSDELFDRFIEGASKDLLYRCVINNFQYYHSYSKFKHTDKILKILKYPKLSDIIKYFDFGNIDILNIYYFAFDLCRYDKPISTEIIDMIDFPKDIEIKRDDELPDFSRLDILKRFLDNGMNPNILYQSYPLINYVIRECFYEVVNLLLKYNPDLYLKDIDGNTALDYFKRIHRSIEDNSIIIYNRSEMIQSYAYILNNNLHFPSKSKSDVDHYLCDPISLELFVDPLIASDGVTYSRSSLNNIRNKYGFISPITRKKLVLLNGDLGIPNLIMKSLIDKFNECKLFILE